MNIFDQLFENDFEKVEYNKLKNPKEFILQK